MHTSAAVYRLVSAACTFYGFKVQFSYSSIFERLVAIFAQKMADCLTLF